MFRHRYRSRRLDDILGFADDIHRGPWKRVGFNPRHRRSRTPSWALILLAGLAGLALAKLMSAGNRSNLSTAQKVIVGGLVVTLGAIILSLRRRAARYNA